MKQLMVSVLIWISLAPNASAASSLESLLTTWESNKHSFAQLSDGSTHFEDSGPKTGPKLVLVHGVSGPMSAWDRNVSFLNKYGFRTLRYDLYGRGFSQRLDRKHPLDLYVRQLHELLEAREFDGSVTLIASSFGCVVSSAFALRYPDRIKRLILIGPAGFPIQVPFAARLRDVPILGDLVFLLFGRAVILEQNRKYFVDEAAWEDYRGFYQAQLEVQGSAEAILSTMRHSPVQSFVSEYGKLGKTKIPVAVIWGKQDATFPFENHKILNQQIPHLELEAIDNSAHLPQFERPEQVNPLLLKWLEP